MYLNYQIATGALSVNSGTRHHSLAGHIVHNPVLVYTGMHCTSCVTIPINGNVLYSDGMAC